MAEWLVFWHPGVTRFDAALGTMVALESKTLASEADAREFIRVLLEKQTAAVSIRRPRSRKPLTGAGLRAWLAQTVA